MTKSKVTHYTVEILPAGKKPEWINMIAIAYFFVNDYKHAGEARYAAGKLAVGLCKKECRVFVVTDYFRGHKCCHQLEEVTETENGIL